MGRFLADFCSRGRAAKTLRFSTLRRRNYILKRHYVMNKKLFPYYNDVRILRLPTTRWAVSTQSRTTVMKEIGLPRMGRRHCYGPRYRFRRCQIYLSCGCTERGHLTPTAAAVIWSSSIPASVNRRRIPTFTKLPFLGTRLYARTGLLEMCTNHLNSSLGTTIL